MEPRAVLRPYLNLLDWRLEALGYRFVRYADDFVVVGKTKRQAEKALQAVTACVEEGIFGLVLNPEKTQVTTFSVKGLTSSATRSRPGTIRRGGKAEERFKRKITACTRRQSYPRCRRGHAGQPRHPWNSPLLRHRLHDLSGTVQ